MVSIIFFEKINVLRDVSYKFLTYYLAFATQIDIEAARIKKRCQSMFEYRIEYNSFISIKRYPQARGKCLHNNTFCNTCTCMYTMINFKIQLLRG